MVPTLAAVTLLSGSVFAQPRWNSPVPSGPPPKAADAPVEALDGVGVTEKLEADVPRAARFQTSEGRHVSLGDVLSSQRPTILTLNYSNCPMLCSVQLTGMVEALKKMKWTLGREYDVVTVSVDPTETPAQAAETKTRYLKQYGGTEQVDELAPGWTFLVGDQPAIEAVADAVGFGFSLDTETGEYLHTAALILLNPQGQVSRYLYGVMYSPQTIRLSLVEAADGKFSSTLDPVIFYCFRYDPQLGGYTLVARNALKVAAAVTLVFVALFVGGGIWRRRSRVAPVPQEAEST